jgi:CBS domain-containing protein
VAFFLSVAWLGDVYLGAQFVAVPAAPELVAQIHNRMPLILAPGDYIGWLSDGPDPRDLLRPFPAEPMRMWPISTRVNKPENDHLSILEPIKLAASVDKKTTLAAYLSGSGIEAMETKSGADEAIYGFVGRTAKQFMTRTVITVSRQTTTRELAALFEKHDFNAFPVVEDEMLLGIISKFDFLRAFAFTTSQVIPHYNELMSRPAAELMTEAVVDVDPTSPLTRVLQLMVSLKTRSFPVMSADCQLEGIISREDVMRALKETTQESDTEQRRFGSAGK